MTNLSTTRHMWAPLLTGALVICGVYFGYDWWNGVPVHWVAQRGEPRTISLRDGTLVQLDADSELVVKMGARVRRASLLRGEALFSVVHQASRPFEVDIGVGRIRAIGTRFDVENLEGSVRVAVLEGRVGVVTGHGELLLVARQSSGYDPGGGLLPLREIDASDVLWQQGQRHFDEAPLPEVLERLRRYHSVTFSLVDPELKRLRLSGTFRMTDLSLFLRTLTLVLPVDVRWIGPHQIALSARPTGSGPRSPRPTQLSSSSP